jgi:hypothetical protein
MVKWLLGTIISCIPQGMGLTLCYYGGYASLGDILDTAVIMRKISQSVANLGGRGYY